MRPTSYISVRAAQNFGHGIRYARDINRPFNTAVTINFSQLGFDDAEAGKISAKLIQRVRQWWWNKKKKCSSEIDRKFIHGIVHENPGSVRNCHWILNIPSDDQDVFRSTVLNRLSKLTGVEAFGDAVQFQPIYNASGFEKYLLKGIDPKYGKFMHISPKDQGVVLGKRIGMSRAVGRTARRSAKWDRKASAARARSEALSASL